MNSDFRNKLLSTVWIASAISVLSWTTPMLHQPVHAATPAQHQANPSEGYTQVSADTVQFYVHDATWADLHYIVNGGGQLNVRMVPNGSDHSFTVSGLPSNASIRYFFTVGEPTGAIDIPWSTLTLGGTPPPGPVDFGPKVKIFDTSMSAAAIQAQVDQIYQQQHTNQFGTARYALLFKPGTYNADVNVGFYTQVAGLGNSPDDVAINGGVHVEADWLANENATQNFWRSAENLSVVPSTGTSRWAVSQAAPLRRMHIRGNVTLCSPYCGWSSGGFIADSVIDGQISSGSQQQWISRNSQWSSWVGGVWNMVFVGDTNTPAASWPNPPYTIVQQTPVVREKPFLTIDASGNYSVFVPALHANSQGSTWYNKAAQGQRIAINQFYIAKEGIDTAASINAALASGKHLILTPGVYHLNDTLRVTRANTVILGLGLATLIPDTGLPAMQVADVDGVSIAGILFDAGATKSPSLLSLGNSPTGVSHASNPSALYDLYFRVGGVIAASADTSLVINSNDVIGDNFWLWRADHGNGFGWSVNPAAKGLVVNGANVTIYGLAVEHYQQYQTLWNGNGGRTYFYQSEAPYDVANQSDWINAGKNGYASYKVSDSVSSHGLWGGGVYCFSAPITLSNSAAALKCRAMLASS